MTFLFCSTSGAKRRGEGEDHVHRARGEQLHTYAWGRHMQEPYDWAVRFEQEAKEMMIAGEYKPLIDLRGTRAGRTALHPDSRSLSAAPVRACD
jgi:hypothetical protein